MGGDVHLLQVGTVPLPKVRVVHKPRQGGLDLWAKAEFRFVNENGCEPIIQKNPEQCQEQPCAAAAVAKILAVHVDIKGAKFIIDIDPLQGERIA